MPDALRRAIRTFFQSFIGAIISSGILSSMAENGVVDWSVLKKTAISAAIAGVVASFTFFQNFLEDNTRVPALLKAQASEGLNPVPDDAGPAVGAEDAGSERLGFAPDAVDHVVAPAAKTRSRTRKAK